MNLSSVHADAAKNGGPNPGAAVGQPRTDRSANLAEPEIELVLGHGRDGHEGRGNFSDLRCFAAVLRITAAVIVVGLSEGHLGSRAWVGLGLALYVLWAAWRLWAESRPTRRRSRVEPWIDLTWLGFVMLLEPSALGPAIGLALTAPVALGTITLGWRHGLALTVAALCLVGLQAWLHWQEVTWLAQALRYEVLALLVTLPLASWSTLPMHRERERQALLARLTASADPRRGLSQLARLVSSQLRAGTDATLAVWLQVDRSDHTAGHVCSAAEGEFALDEAGMIQLVEALRRSVTRPMLVSPEGARGADGQAVRTDAQAVLAQLALALEAKHLVAIPLAARSIHHGWLLFGGADRAWAQRTLRLLGPLQSEILLLAEQAALIDALHDETAAHERARIGRDLHDSAIQPYLGLKFAVDALALRTPPDNPMHDDLQGLSTLVAGELAQLRETISTLRGGMDLRGDDALVPALKRQVRRFSHIFGIEVDLQTPEHLRTSRTLAGALFHMVNEALNNVRKHTEATRIWVRISHQGSCIQLSVRDNAATLRGAPMPDFMPMSLAERARDLGGTVGLHRPDGIDTEVIITVPGEGSLDLARAA